MDFGLLRFCLAALILIGLSAPSQAQTTSPEFWQGQGNAYRTGSTLDLDFVHDTYWLNGTTYTAGSGNLGVQNFITGAGATFTRAGTTSVTSTSAPFYLDSTQGQAFVSRASAANYFNSSGTLTSAATNTARTNYYYNGSSWVSGGTLIEPAATNSIRNNTMVGAVAATPGTAPTNWNIAGGGLHGLTQQIVGTGTSNGINYIDINFSGTTNATSFINIGFESTTQISASNGQNWTASSYLAITGGSTANLSTLTLNTGLYNSGSYLAEMFTPVSWLGVTSTLTRYSAAATIANASTTNIDPYLQFTFNNGAAINITLRIGMPQLEQGNTATNQSTGPTSVIATSGSAVTRSADVYSVPSGGTYFNGSGTLRTAAAGTPRLDYGAPTASELTSGSSGTFTSCSGSSCTGWTTTVNGGTGSVAFSSGTATLTGDGTNAAAIYQSLTTVAGNTYAVTVTTGVGNAVTVQAGTSVGGTQLLAATTIAPGKTTSYQFTATSTTSYIQIGNAGAPPAYVTLVSARSYSPYPNGVLIEEGRTNFVQNNTFSGITTGTYSNACTNSIGGGHWSVNACSPVTVKILATGTQNGIPYLDIEMIGTNVSGSQHTYGFSTPTADQFAVVSGNTTIASAWLGVTAYSSSGGTCSLTLSNRSYDASHANVAEAATNLSAISAFQRIITPILTHGATAAFADGWPYFIIPNGVTCDMTVRFGGLQVEKASFPTSVILTASGTVTRAADVFKVPTTAAGANGAWYTAGVGTLGVSATMPYASSNAATNPRFAGLSDGTISNEVILANASSGSEIGIIQSSGTSTFSQTFSTTPSTLVRSVIAYETGDAGAAFNGTALSTSSGVVVPTMSELDVGNTAGTVQMTGWVNRIWYMPTRQPNSSLPDYSQ